MRTRNDAFFHVGMNLRSNLTLRPRTPAAQSLLEIGRTLSCIASTDTAVEWLQQLNGWHTVYGCLTRERSYAKLRLKNGVWDSLPRKRWWYTHDRHRKAYNVLADIQRNGHLFTYLTTGEPKSTSHSECGINAMIKHTLRLHRGLTIDHQKRVAEWVLIERAEMLNTEHKFPVTNPEAADRKGPVFTETENEP